MSVVVGDKLASTIGVELGSKIVLLTQAADGSMGNDQYTVIGIFPHRLGCAGSESGAHVAPSLQKLLNLEPGESMKSASSSVTLPSARQWLRRCRCNWLPALRFRSWPGGIDARAGRLCAVQSQHNFVLFFIFFLLAVIGIMNTMLMAVFERTRELGMLMALGMRPVQVIGLILAEAAALAAASLVVGAAIGAPLLWYLQSHGLDLGGATGEVVSLAGVVVGHLWFGRQDFPAYGRAALGLAITALVSALYPGVAGRALSANRSDPQGMRPWFKAMRGAYLLMKISWRNLWRNPRGTLLTALALGLGLALLLVSLGLLDGGHEQMVADGVRLGTGHVVIEAKGFQDTGSQELLLPASQ